jgi:hypothetical protein
MFLVRPLILRAVAGKGKGASKSTSSSISASHLASYSTISGLAEMQSAAPRLIGIGSSGVCGALSFQHLV